MGAVVGFISSVRQLPARSAGETPIKVVSVDGLSFFSSSDQDFTGFHDGDCVVLRYRVSWPKGGGRPTAWLTSIRSAFPQDAAILTDTAYA